MNSQSIQILCDDIVAILRQQCEAERVRRLLAGDALSMLRASVAQDVWDAFSLAARGTSAESIGVHLALPASKVDALLRKAWSALRALQLAGDNELRANASAVLQSCARTAEFRRVVDPAELGWTCELGFRLSLEEVARRGVAEAARTTAGRPRAQGSAFVRAIAALRAAPTAEARAAALRVATQQGVRVLAPARSAERRRNTHPHCIAKAERNALVEFFLRQRQNEIAVGLEEQLLRTMFRRRVFELRCCIGSARTRQVG